MKNDVVGEWLDAFGRRPLLPKDRVLELTKIIQNPSTPPIKRQMAQDELVRGNVLLVAGLTQKYLKRRVHFQVNRDDRTLDYLQAALEGLLIAANKYDPERGAFSTCASQWVKSLLSKHHYKHGHSVVHVPQNMMSAYLNGRKIKGSEYSLQCAHRAVRMDSLDRVVCASGGKVGPIGEVVPLTPITEVVQ